MWTIVFWIGAIGLLLSVVVLAYRAGVAKGERNATGRKP